MSNKKEKQAIEGFKKYFGYTSIKEIQQKGMISEKEMEEIKRRKKNNTKYYLIPKKNFENRLILDFREK